MSGETDTPVVTPSGPAVITPGLSDLGSGSSSERLGAGLGTRRGFARQGAGTRVNLRRDQLFRRWLFFADMAAFTVLAVLVLSQLFSRSPRLTWVGVWGLLGLFLGAKVLGLYDRDEAVLHKTTLDEAPKLFHVATLGALCAWLAGGFVVTGGTLDREEALLLWAMLILFLVVARTSARAIALRSAPAERCLLIGDRGAAKTIESKLVSHHGIKADLVAHIDPADVVIWSAEAYSAPRLSEIRDLAQSLDVQRAIVTP